MEKFVLNHREKINSILVFGLMVALLIAPLGLKVSADPEDETENVTVSASITAWLDFAVTKVALDMGELIDATGSGIRGEDSLNVSVGTNNGSGWYLQIAGTGDGLTNYGLYSTQADHLIPTVASRLAVTAENNGYGASAEDILTGETVTVEAPYVYDTENANVVGPIGGTATLASFGGPMALAEVVTLRVAAAADPTTPAAEDYQDTVTITATVSL